MDPLAQAPAQAPEQEYVAQVTIAQKADGTFCTYDPLVPDAKQEFGSLDEAVAAAIEQMSAGDPALTGQDAPLPPDQARSYWDQLAAKKDAQRGG